jgi:hypothetical protein
MGHSETGTASAYAFSYRRLSGIGINAWSTTPGYPTKNGEAVAGRRSIPAMWNASRVPGSRLFPTEASRWNSAYVAVMVAIVVLAVVQFQ